MQEDEEALLPGTLNNFLGVLIGLSVQNATECISTAAGGCKSKYTVRHGRAIDCVR